MLNPNEMAEAERINQPLVYSPLSLDGTITGEPPHPLRQDRRVRPSDECDARIQKTVKDQLFILIQTAQYLSATPNLLAFESGICCDRAESLCHSS